MPIQREFTDFARSSNQRGEIRLPINHAVNVNVRGSCNGIGIPTGSRRFAAT